MLRKWAIGKLQKQKPCKKSHPSGIMSPNRNSDDLGKSSHGFASRYSQSSLAARIRFELTAQTMIPVPGSVATLSHLRSEGYKIGLITDCSAEVPTIWQDTPFAPLFDGTVFSCVVGMKKPDPRIYYLATERLVAKPQSCLCIGDGSSQELTGAATVSMHPALIRFPDENNEGIHRVDAETETWNGPVISSLKEVLTLVRWLQASIHFKNLCGLCLADGEKCWRIFPMVYARG